MKAQLWDATTGQIFDVPSEALDGLTKATWQIYFVRHILDKLNINETITRCTIGDCLSTTTYVFQLAWSAEGAIMVTWNG